MMDVKRWTLRQIWDEYAPEDASEWPSDNDELVLASNYDTLMLALKLICDTQVVSLGLKNGESLEEIETKIAKKSLEMQNAFIEHAKKELIK